MKKAVIMLSSVLVISALLVFVFIGMLEGVIGEIDYGLDEELFGSAGQGTTTTYLAYESGELTEIYQSYGDGRRTSVGLDEMSEYLRLGFISAEDRRFYSHKGVDVRRTLGALLNSLFHFRSDFGGSTITQQVVKNISGDNERSFSRKANEILRAINIERNHTKEEILELYMNIVPMSQNIYGVEEAARRFFGKSCAELSLTEAATIVGITNAPGRYDPIKHPDACLEKRNRVLYAMRDFGAIDEGEYMRAKEMPLGLSPTETEEVSSWFVESARDEIISDLATEYSLTESAARIMLSRGTRVVLTVDTEIQRILEDELENTDNLPAEVANGLNYAMVVTDVGTGNTVGIVGSAGKKRGDRLLNLATVKRPPASVLKPLALYAPMIEDGEISWSTVFDDTPVTFDKKDGKYVAYPKNSPDVYDGLTTVSDALRLSKNTVAVRLFNMRGADRIRRDLDEIFAISELSERDKTAAPLALGQLTEGVTLRALTDAYTLFPAEGVMRGGKCYLGVFSADGRVLLENDGNERRTLSAESARIMNQLLLGVTDNGTARGIRLKELIDTAGKTGTSSGDKDRYFIGYTPYYCAGIRVGYDGADRAVGALYPSHLTVWDRVMTKIHELRVFTRGEGIRGFSTEGLLYLPYCRDSGMAPADACELDARGERICYGYFTEDNSPKGDCDRHISVMYDSLAGAVATHHCDDEFLTEISLVSINRSFPCEVTITDAEYVYRGAPEDYTPIGYEFPYFYSGIPDGEYVGRSKNKKQFNSGCYTHSGK